MSNLVSVPILTNRVESIGGERCLDVCLWFLPLVLGCLPLVLDFDEPCGINRWREMSGCLPLVSAFGCLWFALPLVERCLDVCLWLRDVWMSAFGCPRLVLPVKNNLVRESTGLAYRLEEAQG